MKLNLSLSNLVTKAARVIVRHYQKECAPLGITAPQGGVIYILNIIGPSAQVEVASVLHLEKTNINSMIKKLERSGIVKVQKDSTDSRKSMVALTAKGIEMAKKLNAIDKKVSAFYKSIAGNDKNIEIIKSFLEKIVFND
jgi:DNA-binding MarR family transcriptional regulator